jgi:uncharacterized protein YwgA
MNEASVGWLMKHLGVSVEAVNDSFSARFRMQKAGFLLKCLGVRPFFGYDFGLYVHGPYSSTLAKQYYAIKKAGGPASLLPETIQALDWFIGHDERWIELASATLSSQRANFGIGKDALFLTLRFSKPWVDRATFERIHGELGAHSLFR